MRGMTNLVNLRTKCRNEFIKIDPNSKVWSDPVIDSYINTGYFQVQKDGQFKRRENQTIAPYTFSTVGGTQQYALPTDFMKNRLVRYNGQRLRRYDKMALEMQSTTMPTGTPYGYYIDGTQLGLYPVPTGVGTVEMFYLKRLPVITTTQQSLYPEDFDNAIVAYAKYMAWNSVQKIGAPVQQALTDYNMLLTSLVSAYLQEDNFNMSWGQPRVSGVQRADVLGGYGGYYW